MLVLERGREHCCRGPPQDVVSSYPGVIVQTDSPPPAVRVAPRHRLPGMVADDPPTGSTRLH